MTIADTICISLVQYFAEEQIGYLVEIEGFFFVIYPYHHQIHTSVPSHLIYIHVLQPLGTKNCTHLINYSGISEPSLDP